MKDDLKLIIKYFLRFILKIFWIFPIKKKTVFFMANMGKGFLCNPKYIYLSMLLDIRFEDFSYIWCFTEPEKEDKDKFSINTKLVNKKNYIRYFYYLLTSEVIIYNCGGFSYAPIRRKQFLIETGHGGGLQKRNGFMVENKSAASNKGISLACRDIKIWLASDEMHEKIYIRKAMGYKGEVLKSGYPRSDLFFLDTKALKQKIRHKLGVEEGKKIILYAPTFRGNEDCAYSFSKSTEQIDIELVKKTLHKYFGGDWLFAVRGHLYVQTISLDGADFDWTTYEDMQEILLIADVLITDYSSCIWDFFLLRKPAFLYIPDRDYYEKKDRGFYIPLEEWPAEIVNRNNEWETVISKFNISLYKDKLDKYKKMMNPYEHGVACSMVKDRILTQLGR